MAKKVLTAIAVLTMAMLAFAGCASTKWGPVPGASKDDPVKNNGGFLVEKGNYIYFINGVADSTVDNTFGTPVQGAIVVADKNDLKAEAKVVVPKAVVAGDKTAGIYIFGEWIYYATPNSNKDKNGEVQSSYLDFCRTKLDGTATETALYTASNAAPYRFAEIDGTVYLAYYESSSKNLISYNFDTKTSTVIAEAVSGYTFSSDEGYDSVFYTKLVDLDKENNVTASYNKVYKLSFKGGEPTEILSGVPKTVSGEAASSTGLVFSVKSHMKGALIYTASYVDNTTFRGGYVLKDTDVTADAVQNAEEKAYKLSAKDANFSSSLFAGFDDAGKPVGYVYSDTTYGLMLQEYGADQPVRISTCTTTTLVTIENGYVYFSTGDDFVRAALTDRDVATKDLKVITENYYNTSWYKPEFVGNDIYYGDSTYGLHYIFRADLTAEEIKGELVGKYTDADKKTAEEKIKEEQEAEEK